MKHPSILAVLILALLAAPASAQTDIGAEVAQLRRSIDQAVLLLEQQLKRRDEDLRLRRLQIAVDVLQMQSAGVVRLEREVRNAEDDAKSYTDQAERMTAEFDQWMEMAGNPAELSDDERLQLEMGRKQYEREVEQLKKRAWDAEQRAVDARLRLREHQDAIEDLQAFVEEELARTID